MLKVKVCRTCGVVLTTNNAYLNRKRGTLQSACKSCGSAYSREWVFKNKVKERLRQKQYYHKNKVRLTKIYDRSRVIRKYGITHEQIEAMRVAQKGLCLICQSRPAKAVDHCHTTKKVRGLLCTRCNMALGQMLDNPEWLRRAADYLEKL